MIVNKTIETDKGTVRFEGELEQKELDMVIQCGLNWLLINGAIPFTTVEAADLHDEKETLQ